jgi:hypothetical protein
MATQVQLRRGNTSQTNAFTGAVAEITVDTDKNTIVVHDGSTAGGFPLALENADSATGSYANSAFAAANTASETATSAGVYANGAFIAANTAQDTGTSAGSYANSAFSAANTASAAAATAEAAAVALAIALG